MAYKDDFYIEDNIIGYTGELGNNPTVYFQKGNDFGRITQTYPEADNIGRNKVRTYADYRIYNNSEGVAEEFYDNGVQHTSRNAFVAVSADNKATLAACIAKFPDIKSKYAS